MKGGFYMVFFSSNELSRMKLGDLFRIKQEATRSIESHTDMILSAQLNVVEEMYARTQVSKMNNYFLRVMHAIKVVVATNGI